MAVTSKEDNSGRLTAILERLLSEAEFRQQFVQAREETLLSLGLSTVEYSALLHLDVAKFVETATSIPLIYTCCIYSGA